MPDSDCLAVAPVPARRRWRFSLRTLLLVTTIVAMALVIAWQYRELQPLRAENRRLNEERGTLVLVDPERVNAIHIPSRFAGGAANAFRVSIPPGRRYLAIVVVNEIPRTGYPEARILRSFRGIVGTSKHVGYASLDPGEHVIAVEVQEHWDGKQNKQDVRIVCGIPGTTPLYANLGLSADGWPNSAAEAYRGWTDVIASRTEIAGDDGRLVLLRKRLQPTFAAEPPISEFARTFVAPEPNEPLDGMMLWLEPLP